MTKIALKKEKTGDFWFQMESKSRCKGDSSEWMLYRSVKVPKCVVQVRKPRNGPISSSSFSLTAQVCDVEYRSMQHSDRWSVSTMEPERLLRFRFVC